MTEPMTADQARAVVYDAYTTGLPQAAAAQLLAGKESPAWVTHEYAALRRRGVSAMAGQQTLFDTEATE